VSICFLIDAQLPPVLAHKLLQRGYPAEHVNRIGLGIASDRAIWSHARRTSAALITKDEDFVRLAQRELAGPSVVWVRVGNISNEALWHAIDSILDEIVEALSLGERVVEVI
jgi:predicted nuclease of predicted toxin-antitoxin system